MLSFVMQLGSHISIPSRLLRVSVSSFNWMTINTTDVSLSRLYLLLLLHLFKLRVLVFYLPQGLQRYYSWKGPNSTLAAYCWLQLLRPLILTGHQDTGQLGLFLRIYGGVAPSCPTRFYIFTGVSMSKLIIKLSWLWKFSLQILWWDVYVLLQVNVQLGTSLFSMWLRSRCCL